MAITKKSLAVKPQGLIDVGVAGFEPATFPTHQVGTPYPD